MLSCTQHDMIEIACMYRFPVKLTLKSGSVISGTSVDTRHNEHQQECMVLEADGVETLVVLEDIAKMQAGIKNPHFQEISFS